MLIFAITSPQAQSGEVAYIRQLLAHGVDILHFRKPQADISYCKQVLTQLTPIERKKIVVHDHFCLYEEFALRGVHVNKNITHLPDNYIGSRSRSCHSLEEIETYKNNYDYLFLSPIFNSISKVGYNAAFTHNQLKLAADKGIIDHKVIALGGVTLDKIPYLKSLHFGGVAMLGAINSILNPANENT